MEEKKSKLYLNMIVGDFEPVEIVKRSIDSVKEYVDGIYITVTYTEKKPTSTHPLIKLLKEYNAHITQFKWIDDFSKARQFALDQVPRGENIFVYWQDADDILRGAENLPSIVNTMVDLQQAAVFFRYWYMVELDEKGDVREVLIEHKRERIIRNDDTFKWIGDLHETLIQQKQENLIRVGRDEAIVIHLSNRNRIDKNTDRNIRILEAQAIREKHRDPRTLVYLGKAYLDRSKTAVMPQKKIDMDMALLLLNKYLVGEGTPGMEGYITPSGWREERATAYAAIAEIALLSQQPEIAVNAYKSAIEEAYEFPNYYVDLAMTYCLLKDFKQAKHWLKVASHIPMPLTTIITFPRDLRLRASQASLEINMYEGNLKLALEDAVKIYDISPSENNKNNIEVIKGLIATNQAAQSVLYLTKFLESHGEDKKIAHLIQAVPNSVMQEKFVSEIRHKYMPIKLWGENEITILCGPGFEKWSPKSIQTGIGGSEEAVIRLSEELTKAGWQVTVYGNPMEDAGNYNGVEYKNWYDLNYKDNFNVLVLWRSIGFVDVNPKAKFTLLWLHDVPNNPDFTEERIAKIDKIAVLSEYHKSLLRIHDKGTYKAMPEEKVFLTGNGIPPISYEWKGNPHRMVYMSSPDRGLIYLLNNWEKIKEEVEDAELHIFYGFNVFDALYRDNPGQQEWKKNMIRLMKQPGIVFHDRVGHEALHYELSKSGIWAYPTDFTEISCISAMKAQACGAIPIVTNYAALEETVKNGFKVDVDITTEEGQKEYIAALIKGLKDSEWQTSIRKNMISWARDYFAWKNVAQNWDTLFRVKIQNPEHKLIIDRKISSPKGSSGITYPISE